MRKYTIVLAGIADIPAIGLRRVLDSLHFNLAYREVSIAEIPEILNETTGPDVIFLDIHTKENNGYKIAVSILKRIKKAKVVLVSGNSPNRFLGELLELGIKGIITPETGAKEITDIFRSVIAGDSYLFNFPRAELKKVRFTEKELDLIAMLADGQTTKEISLRLNKSFKTIETCRLRLLRKTQTRNTCHLLNLILSDNIFGVRVSCG